MRSCLIIGASDGLGRSLAKSLSHMNYSRLDLLGQTLTKLEQLKKEIESETDCHVTIYSVDLSNDSQVETFLNKYVQDTNSLDLLILAAATLTVGPFLNMSASDISTDYHVNLLSQLKTVHRVSPLLKKSKGHIAAIHSLAGQIPHPKLVGYSGSKSGLHQSLHVLEIEFEYAGITVSHIYPPGMNTSLTKKMLLPRWVYRWFQKDPDQVAKHICKAIEHKRRYYYGAYFECFIGRAFWILPSSIRRVILRLIQRNIQPNHAP